MRGISPLNYWRGDQYEKGIDDQRIGIVGYSAYFQNPGEKDIGTVKYIQDVIDGKCQIKFTSAIKNWFGFIDHSCFWPRVIFFNFIPDIIGHADQKFSRGSEEQVKRGRERFTSILAREKPDKVFVFTNKGWQSCPPTREETETPNAIPPRFGAQLPGFTWGTYDVGGHIVTAFGLRHPFGANCEEMTRTVRYLLKFRSERA